MAGPNPSSPGVCRASEAGVLIFIKVVPGSSRDRVMGLLGDRLKVAVAAAPEGGKANDAVCKLLAGVLGISPRQVRVIAGHTSPIKTIEVQGAQLESVREQLSAYLQ